MKMQPRGFTLAEMAVVLAVLAIVIGGLLMPLSAQVDVRSTRETERMLETAREALVGFAMTHGRLPCPALPGLATGGSADTGKEALTNTPPPPRTEGATGRWCQTDSIIGDKSAVSVGVLPWRTLGLPETDAWGRRVGYAVTSIFADEGGCPSTNPQVASFCADARGVIDIVTRSEAGGPLAATASDLAAVVISYGRNGFNAVMPDGSTRMGAAGSDENRNRLSSTRSPAPEGGPSLRLVSRPVVRTTDACSDEEPGQMCEFDDLVVGIGVPRLVERMVAVGRLP